MAFAFIWGEQRADGSYSGLLDCFEGPDDSLGHAIEEGFFETAPLEGLYEMDEVTFTVEGSNLANFVTNALIIYENESRNGVFFQDPRGIQIPLTHIIITTSDRKLVIADISEALCKQAYKLLEDY